MRTRAGFTLVEMLVAMTLTLFIMVIVTTAFTAGLETFNGMKGIGDLQQSLRMAGQRIQNDLKAQHFEGNRHLGDPAFPSQGAVQYGFVRIVQGSSLSSIPGAPYFYEGIDLDAGNPATPLSQPSARAVDHILHFSNNVRGDRPQDFYSAVVPLGAGVAAGAPVPPASPLDPDPNNLNQVATNFFKQPFDAMYQKPGVYTSQWVEVAYFLVRSGSTSDPNDPTNNAGTPLYSLYRIERLVVPRNDNLLNLIPFTQLSTYAAFSCQPDNPNPQKAQWLVFNTPENLAAGQRSFNLPTDPTASLGAALVVSNVVSFQVLVSYAGEPFPVIDPTVIQAPAPLNFDTATQGATPTRVSGVQVTLRLWDPVTGQSRQVTIFQEM
jgi:prepilin-type N-terminal cleavage/methylation domain-containing protein